MSEFILEDLTKDFLLCHSCNQVTGLHFPKCHHCKQAIVRKFYTQTPAYSIERYHQLVKVLKTLTPRDFEDDTCNMISIRQQEDDSQDPELWQIVQMKDGYWFHHFYRGQSIHHTHLIVINQFVLYLPSFLNYYIDLNYGDSPLFINPW